MKKTLVYFFLAFSFFCIRQYVVIVPSVMSYSLAALFGILLGIIFFSPKYTKVTVVALIPVAASMVEATFGKLDPSQRMVVLYGTLLSLGIAYSLMFGLTKNILALPTKLTSYIGAYGLGLLLGCIGFFTTPNQQLPYLTNISLLWILLPLFAVTEELVFRRLIYEELSPVFGEAQAIAGTAVIFAGLHVGLTVVPFIVSYLASIVLTILYKREHNFWISVFANIFMKIIFLFLLLTILHTPLITYLP